MNEIWSWDDLRLFLAVTRAGGLAGAARTTGVSAPTLGRRMAVLERGLGRQLFHRRRDGYDLTPEGRELLPLAETLELEAVAIDRWRSAHQPSDIVRIAAGAWTSAFLARHLDRLVEGEAGPIVELVTGTSTADLLRREANLGLRNQRPELPGLAGYRLARVAFALYGERAFVAAHPETRDDRRFRDCRWIAFAPPGPKTPSAAWLDHKLGRAAALSCRAAQDVLEAARAGFGLCVLPCFIGDSQTGLARASDIIIELTHEQWLVSHDDDRQHKAIRRVSEKLKTLIRAHRPLFAGERAA